MKLCCWQRSKGIRGRRAVYNYNFSVFQQPRVCHSTTYKPVQNFQEFENNPSETFLCRFTPSRSRCMQHHMDIFEKADFIVTPTTACTASPVREVAEKYGELDYQNGGKLMRFIIAGNLRSASNFYTGRVWWQRVANRAPADWEAMVRSYTAANGNCIWENLCTSTPTWSLFRPPEMIQPEPRWKHLLLSGFRRVRT